MHPDRQIFCYVCIHILRLVLPCLTILFIAGCAKGILWGRRRPFQTGFRLNMIQVLMCAFLWLEGFRDLRHLLACFGGIFIMQWARFASCRKQPRESECLAFFLSSICLVLVFLIRPAELYKQFFAIALGFTLYILLLRLAADPCRAEKTACPASTLGILLMLAALLWGKEVYGARNWLHIGGLSMQPSEFLKLSFLLFASVTADCSRKKRLLFIAYAVAVFLMLAGMNDYGTLFVFYGVFLVMLYLREDGGWILTAAGGIGAGACLAITILPHGIHRLQAWRHIWEDPFGFGFQQTQALMAVAAGGLFGLGPGQGKLKRVFSADADLAFAAVCEEWGLVIALTCTAGILLMGIAAARTVKNGNTRFCVISAGAAATFLLVQMGIHVLGTADILPMSGINFPFLSNGGSSMVSCWCLLAFLQQGGSDEKAHV